MEQLQYFFWLEGAMVNASSTKDAPASTVWWCVRYMQWSNHFIDLVISQFQWTVYCIDLCVIVVYLFSSLV